MDIFNECFVLFLSFLNSIKGKPKNKINFVRYISLIFVQKNKAQSYNETISSYKLRNDKFARPGYDKWIRPVVNESTTTNISFNLSLLQLLEIVSRQD